MKKEAALVLLILVDAFRKDYQNTRDAPFLTLLAGQSIHGSLQPSFGFEPEGAYLAGLHPDEYNGGLHYWYEPEGSPFRIAARLPPALDQMPNRLKTAFRRLLTAWVRRTTLYQGVSVHNIPLPALPQFAPAHKHPPYEPESPWQPNLFSLCDAHGIAWLFHGAPCHIVGVEAGIERMRMELRPPVQLAFWHIGDLDRAGHAYGPGSAEQRAAMRRVDAGLRAAEALLQDRYSRVDWVVFGDHGMARVTGRVDVQARLTQMGVRQGDGAWYFLDSTLARFWFAHEPSKSRVVAALESLPGGRILQNADLDRYHLNYAHNRFGELLYLADPGRLILPNFYQGCTPLKGMHGYAPEWPEQQSAFLVCAPEKAAPRAISSPVDMRRIFPTALDLLGLPRPEGLSAKSLI